MSKRSKISLIIGGIVLLASIAIYIICPVIFPSTILGLCFLLYSEIVFFGGFVLIDFLARKSSKVLLWSGIAIPLGAYALVVFISSLIFMGARTTAIQGYLVFHIIALVVTVAICLIIGSFSVGAKERDEKVLGAGRTVQYAIDQLTLIKERADKKADVEKLIEGLRFSDTSVTVDADVELSDAIAALQNLVLADKTGDDEFTSAVQRVDFLIKKRNLQTRASKQGGI